MWWLVHVTVLYWGIRFPFHARSFETSGKNKYIHLTAVVLGLCLPAMPPIIVGSFGDPTLIRFPVLVCSSGKAGMSFYSTILPSAVLQTVGCSILILIGWTISQVRGTCRYTLVQYINTRRFIHFFHFYISCRNIYRGSPSIRE